MGREKGHAPALGAGRPKGSKDSKPRTRINMEAEEIRKAITTAFREREPAIIDRLFKQIMTLEGYAYVSSIALVLRQIMPQLQSIELNAKLEQKQSVLIEHIESLKINK